MPFIPPNDERWKELLKVGSFDFYHLPEYSELEAWLQGGKVSAWYYSTANIFLLIPLIARENTQHHNYLDLVSPYGYPGVLVNGIYNNREIVEILEIFNEEATEAGFVSSFIRLNPFLNDWELNQSGNWKQLFHGATVTVNIKELDGNVRDYFSNNHRRNLHKLDLAGAYTKLNDFSSFPQFIASYHDTMKRKNANPYYLFPPAYFDAIQNILNDALLYISVHNRDDSWLAGGLFTVLNSTMQFHLGATATDAVHHSPSKLMIEHAILEAKQRGISQFHLGGGIGGQQNDGLFRFKNGFGKEIHRFSTLRFIHDEEKYRELCTYHMLNASYEGFFPTYRAHDKEVYISKKEFEVFI